jgi:hypothetical protein
MSGARIDFSFHQVKVKISEVADIVRELGKEQGVIFSAPCVISFALLKLTGLLILFSFPLRDMSTCDLPFGGGN